MRPYYSLLFLLVCGNCQLINNGIPVPRLEYAKLYGNVSESQAASYDRDNESYPYKSHGQWFKAFYGMVTCVILLLLNGVGAFLENPFGVTQFVSAYISASLPVQPI